MDLVLEVWLPGSSLTMEHVGSGPDRGSELDKNSPVGLKPTQHAIIRSTMDSSGMDGKLTGAVVKCQSDQPASDQQQIQKSEHHENNCFPAITHGWRFLKFGAVAFKIGFPPSGSKSASLSLIVWGNTLKKNAFLYHGYVGLDVCLYMSKCLGYTCILFCCIDLCRKALLKCNA